MKYLKTFEKYKIDDLVWVKGWDYAKIIKAYDSSCLVEFEDGYQTTVFYTDLEKLKSKEIRDYKNKQKEKKFNI